MNKFVPALILFGLNLIFADEDKPIVTLRQGKLKGFVDVSSEGSKFFTFLNIPYAKPPIQELRFEPAQEPENWKGVREATENPPRCAQIKYWKMLSEDSFDFLGSEDCLYLNIFTKKMSEQEKLPVMVYIHGGGYTAGGINALQPHYLLNRDVVLVTIQYRVGLLGFLWTEDLAMPSNLGLKDQTLALKWINANIHNFGGDPKKVTILGQSAGGGSVHAHLLSDYSKGLFTRAIMQSGNLLCPCSKMSKPRKTALRVGENLGCFADFDSTDEFARSLQLLECLKEADVADIMNQTRQTFQWSFLPKRSVPYYDGDFFSDEIETLVSKGKMKSVDVIIGVVRDEGAFVSNAMLVLEDQRLAIKDKFSTIGPISLAFEREENSVELAKRAYDYYVGGVKNEFKDYPALTRMFGDHHFKICSDHIALHYAKLNAKTNKSTYFYEVHHKGERSLVENMKNPPLAKDMICHADELFHLFVSPYGALNKRKNEEDLKVAKIMTDLWVNFATNGNPTPDLSMGFKWEPFTEESTRHLKILPQPTMEDDNRFEERRFWNSLPTKSNQLLFKDKIKDEL